MGPELLVAGWFASVVINKIAEMLFSYAEVQKNLQQDMKDEFERLRIALPKTQVVLDAVEKGQILIKGSNPNLEAWMWQLRDAADKVLDDLAAYDSLKEAEKRRKNQLQGTAISHLKMFVRRAMRHDRTLKQLKLTLRRLDEVACNGEAFLKLVKHHAGTQKQQQKEYMRTRVTGSAVSTSTGKVVGRGGERDKIIQMLLNGSAATVPIVGMSGVGKTTLAQYIYNDPKVEEHFQLRVWVFVSKVFDVSSLTKSILEGATGTRAFTDNFASFQKKLIQELKTKRYLLVLDDVWNDADWASWDTLYASLRHGQSGSKVLITTQLRTVVEVIPSMVETFHLEGLQAPEFWLLFKSCAFGDADPSDHPMLLDIGLTIAKKLNGHPSAAKAVGRLLMPRLDDDYWVSILKSIMQEQNTDTKEEDHVTAKPIKQQGLVYD